MLNDAERQQTEAVRAQFRMACDQARGSGLSLGEKTREIAQAKVLADSQLDRIRVASEAREALLEEVLERKLFRPNRGDRRDSYAVLAARDAADRCSEITSPEEAIDMLLEAERRGDAGMSRAIMHEAFDRSHSGPAMLADGWVGVVKGYIAAHPDSDSDLAELDDIVRGRMDQRATMQDAMFLGVPYPEELPHNDPAIALMAKGEL